MKRPYTIVIKDCNLQAKLPCPSGEARSFAYTDYAVCHYLPFMKFVIIYHFLNNLLAEVNETIDDRCTDSAKPTENVTAIQDFYQQTNASFVRSVADCTISEMGISCVHAEIN